ncbi:hypothetical protein E2C01_100750 [Portunus trituberculatus]|uniref:Uncharacterized protein n=1 Tax=Portunus trituberculatus TaxID=210409 RepID=A0A5B7KD06_PORTR|nr:hypothetical protein [Portunus trituberculatus]
MLVSVSSWSQGSRLGTPDLTASHLAAAHSPAACILKRFALTLRLLSDTKEMIIRGIKSASFVNNVEFLLI